MNKRISVGCVKCGWTGRRVFNENECDCGEPCWHTGFGNCPKCGQRVRTSAANRALVPPAASATDAGETK